MTSTKLTPEMRYAVAVVIWHDGAKVLAVRRPDDPGEELPGVWGLPAATLRPGETPEEGVRRVGLEKLGVRLMPARVLAEGEQHRAHYTLRMVLYEATIAGEPVLPRRTERADVNITQYDAIDWLPAEALHDAADRGSLCCLLFLQAVESGKAAPATTNPPP